MPEHMSHANHLGPSMVHGYFSNAHHFEINQSVMNSVAGNMKTFTITPTTISRDFAGNCQSLTSSDIESSLLTASGARWYKIILLTPLNLYHQFGYSCLLIYTSVRASIRVSEKAKQKAQRQGSRKMKGFRSPNHDAEAQTETEGLEGGCLSVYISLIWYAEQVLITLIQSDSEPRWRDWRW